MPNFFLKLHVQTVLRMQNLYSCGIGSIGENGEACLALSEVCNATLVSYAKA